MNMELSYLVIAIVILCAFVDRFAFVRGAFHVSQVKQHGNADGMIRFAMDYAIKTLPMWSEVRYSLVDKRNPTTVISGKTRGLDFSRKGFNSEFLLFKEDIVKPGDWELKIKVITVAGRLNPLYSLFPVQHRHTHSFTIQEK